MTRGETNIAFFFPKRKLLDIWRWGVPDAFFILSMVIHEWKLSFSHKLQHDWITIYNLIFARLNSIMNACSLEPRIIHWDGIHTLLKYTVFRTKYRELNFLQKRPTALFHSSLCKFPAAYFHVMFAMRDKNPKKFASWWTHKIFQDYSLTFTDERINLKKIMQEKKWRESINAFPWETNRYIRVSKNIHVCTSPLRCFSKKWDILSRSPSANIIQKCVSCTQFS